MISLPVSSLALYDAIYDQADRAHPEGCISGSCDVWIEHWRRCSWCREMMRLIGEAREQEPQS